METWGTCCHSISSERPSVNADVKNSSGDNNNNNNDNNNNLSNNDKETEMGRKPTVWVFAAKNWRNFPRGDLDRGKKEKLLEENSSNSNTNQRHKNQLCLSENI